MRDPQHRHAHGQPTGTTNPPHPTPPRPRRALSRCALLSAALTAAPAAAATQLWQAAPDTPSDWFTPASWTTGVPTSNDTAFINNAGTAQIASGTAAVRSLTLGDAATNAGTLSITGGQLRPASSQTITVGNTGTGAISQSAGKVTLPSTTSLYLASAPTSSASYQLSGTGLLVGYNEYLGYGGTASFVQTGGTHSFTAGFPSLYLAYQPTSTASYSLSGTGQLGGSSLASQYIGYGGSATFTQTGGTNTGVDSLYLGYNATATGTYSLSGTGKLSLDYIANAYVGYSGAGTFVQSGGTFAAPTISDTVYLGYNARATGSYTLSDGQLGLNVIVGESGTGTITQTGGTITGSVLLGDKPGSAGTLLLSGGQISPSYSGNITVGGDGNGTVIQTGGTVTLGTSSNLGTLAIAGGYNSQSTASYTLSGTTASIRAAYLEMANHGGQSASFVQNGGAVSLTRSLSIGPYYSTATGCYTLNAGSLTAGSISIGGVGSATFVQSGGTVSLGHGALNVTVLATPGSPSSYLLSSGSLTSGSQYIDGATFTQSGGVNTIGNGTSSYRLELAGPASYTLSNDAQLLAGPEYIGMGSGNTTFTQTGGINDLHGNILWIQYIPYPDGSNLNGTYLLSGTGQLRAGAEIVGFGSSGIHYSGTALFRQTGGDNQTQSLTINPTGRYELLAGTLTLTGPLTIAPGGSLDLTAGTLTLAYGTSPSPADTIRQYLLTSLLTTSSADLTHRLGYLDTPTAFSGEPTAPSSLLIKLTLTGDANLDGQLTDADYDLLETGYAQNLTDWSHGDFNYDGSVTSADYLLIDTAYGQAQAFSPGFLSQRESQFGPTYVSTLLASIPEPSSLAACGLALLPLLRRRTKS